MVETVTLNVKNKKFLYDCHDCNSVLSFSENSTIDNIWETILDHSKEEGHSFVLPCDFSVKANSVYEIDLGEILIREDTKENNFEMSLLKYISNLKNKKVKRR